MALVALIAGAVGGSIGGGTVAYFLSKAPATTAPVKEPSSDRSQQVIQADDSALVEVVNTIGPAVVTVISKVPGQIDLYGEISEEIAAGSGVIVDKRGYIVTNQHVVEESRDLSVILFNGERKSANLVGTDYPFTDLAVIKIEAEGLAAVELGDSDQLAVGQRVIAIGSALGDFRNTVTAGIVSGLHRSWGGDDILMEDLIQTDAAINYGNSGGALASLTGKVIGINTMVIRRGESGEVVEGMGFAIPSNTVMAVAQQLIEKGKVSRPYLGIAHRTIMSDMAYLYDLPAKQGIYITEVVPNSPAARASLQPGDILTKINNDTIDSSHPFLNILMKYEPLEEVALTIIREGKETKVKVVLAERK
jgi:2-alkenal reductase